jgi:hypothetical protein
MHATAARTGAASAGGFHSSGYPRTYRVSARNRILYFFVGGLILAGGLAGAWYFGTGHETESPQEAIILVVLCLAFVALGGVLILYMLTSKIVLYSDAIEWRDFLRVRKLRREDIAGRRSQDAHYVSVLVLVPKRAGMKKLKITRIMQTDFVLDAWFGTLPDLDTEELEKSRSDIIASRDLGRTPEARAQRLAHARKVAMALTTAAVAVSAWAFFFPEPYEIAIAALAALPLLALVLAAKSGRLYQVVGRRNDARANLAVAFIAPGVVLALRAILDIAIFDWAPLWTATIVVASTLTIAMAVWDREVRSRGAELVAMLIVCGCYAYGGIAEANALFDQSASQIFRATVVGKRVSHGKSTQYYLQLTPWGPRREEREVSVSHTLYAATATGGQVCIIFRAGALQIRWFVVSACR